MTFKYSFTFPISGSHKLIRFQRWIAEHAPDIEVSLPPQVPVDTEAMTIRLKSLTDRQTLIARLAEAAI